MTSRSTPASRSKPPTSASCPPPTTCARGCRRSSRSARRGSAAVRQMVVADARPEPPRAAGVAPARAVLTRLAIRDFRNLARLDLAPPPDGFALIGENGQGKTNLLEAIHYLQLLRSFRGARDA